MSSDFYFRKWKKTLGDLKRLVNSDLEFQDTRVHDRTECEAVHTLTRVLGRYIAAYNDGIECLQQNLQVQKTKYMKDIIEAVVSRILELKHELKKLECSDIVFLSKGLADDLLTVDDAELKEIPGKIKRLEYVQTSINETMKRAREKKEILANPEPQQESIQLVQNWWEIDENAEVEDTDIESSKELSEDVCKTREFVALIQAHEKSRQTIRMLTHKKQKRELWAKELAGTKHPQPRYELKEKSSRLIQEVLRAYLEVKRQKLEQFRRDEILGINYYVQLKRNNKEEVKKMLKNRPNLHDKYENQWETYRNQIKEQYLNKKKDELIEDYRDQIRAWFQDWFGRIKFIHDIPKNGSAAIFLGEMLQPAEWLEEHKQLLVQQKANKKKSAEQLMFEKMAANKERMMLKREEHIKRNTEAALMKKIMKNPTMHPGYIYPRSKNISQLVKVIKEYDTIWFSLDELEPKEVKEQFVHEIDVENTLMEAKLEILPIADEQMKKEFRKLKTALQEDYARNKMQMPEDIKKRNLKRRNKKKKKIKQKVVLTQDLIDKIEEFAVKGFINDYSKVRIEDFVGDPNFVGEDMRCQLLLALPFNAETRAFWWKMCRDVVHGFNRILLVGPKGSGKTKLVHALASTNDAVLFKLDPLAVQGDFLSAAYLQQIVQTIALCAKAVQPAVIHIEHVEKLFYLKVPPDEAEMCLDMIKNFFISKLFKRFKKSDNITIIGSCVDPWTTKSRPLLKHFPTILLLPNTAYSIIIQVLKNWVINHGVIPADFKLNSLAHMLQGYSFGYLQEAFESFMTAERVVHIAAYGLSPMEVYSHILECQGGTSTDYDKYLAWYMKKTKPGKKQQQHLEERREYKQAIEQYIEKTKKKKKTSGPSNKSSKTTL